MFDMDGPPLVLDLNRNLAGGKGGGEGEGGCGPPPTNPTYSCHVTESVNRLKSLNIVSVVLT